MPMKFHADAGGDIALSDNGYTAEYIPGPSGNFWILSDQSLFPREPFIVEVKKTLRGDRVSMLLGVTHIGPNTRPRLGGPLCELFLPSPSGFNEMKDTWYVTGREKFHDMENVGQWGGDLKVSPGETVGVMWDGQAVFIIVNGTTTQVFTNILGPVWARIQLFSVDKISVVSPAPKPVKNPIEETKLASIVPRPGPTRPSRPEPPNPTRGEGLFGAKNDMIVRELMPQSMGACGGVTPRTSSIACTNWQVCDRFIDSLKLPSVYLNRKYHYCYCIDCITARGDDLYYARGVPPKLYSLPQGWCRFGLSVPAKAYGMEVFDLWHVAYHGTIPKNIRTIIESDLLMPGDYTLEGNLLAPPAGHFTETHKPGGFDIKQVFVSPTIAYAGQPAYARPQRWTDPMTGQPQNIQVALQVRIKPDAYQVGKETLGLGSERLEAKFDNSELEWSTKIRGSTILQGILVKTSY